MSDMFGGALVSEGLRQLIAEAKKFKDFKPLSVDLKSTMERLIPLTEKIDSLQKVVNLDDGELKKLEETMKRAQIVVRKCQGRGALWFKRSKRTRDIELVNKDMLKFCQIDVQLLQHRNQLQSMKDNNNNFQTVIKQIEQLSVPAPVFRHLCLVPQLKKVPVGFDWPLMVLQKKLLDVSVDRLVVSAPAGCGKTTLVTHLCHDEDVKSKYFRV